MYSVVLATALTAGTGAPATWCHFGCPAYCAPAFCAPAYYAPAYYGCCGSCYGCYGSCYGCYGSCYSCYGAYYGCYGTCYGCTGYYGSCYGCYGAAYYPTTVVPVAPVEPVKPKAGMDKPKEEVRAMRPATVVVKAPMDAKVTANGTVLPISKAATAFDTPKLEMGQRYWYEFTAEANRGGKLVTLTKKVAVEAGKEVVVDFNGEMTADAAAAKGQPVAAR